MRASLYLAVVRGALTTKNKRKLSKHACIHDTPTHEKVITTLNRTDSCHPLDNDPCAGRRASFHAHIRITYI